MTDAVDPDAVDPDAAGPNAVDARAVDARAGYNVLGSAVIAVIVGVVLAVATRLGAVELLVAVAAVQALLAFGYVFALAVPGWLGALLLAGLASGAADAVTSIWPHARLGVLLGVFGLAVPVMFVHQLWRGAARTRLVDSLGAIAVLVLAEVTLPALLQVRHDFRHSNSDVCLAVIAVVAGALLVGLLVDMVAATPRFAAEVPRGLLAVAGSAVVGAAIGQLVLHDSIQFGSGRAVFAGACLGALVGLFAIGVAYVESTSPLAEAGFSRRVRPALGVVLPMCLLAPVAFLLFSAIRR